MLLLAESHTHRIWSNSFRLVVTWLTERTYVRTRLQIVRVGWGRLSKGKEGCLRPDLVNPSGGYSIYSWVGRCGAAPHTLTLFKTLFLTMVIVFGLFCYCHSVIKSRATCRPKSRCQSDLSTVSVLVNRSLHQDLMHSGTVERRFQMFVYRPFRFSHSQPRSTKGLFTNLWTGLWNYFK